MNGATIATPAGEPAEDNPPYPVPITASQVRVGDILAYDGREIEVTL